MEGPLFCCVCRGRNKELLNQMGVDFCRDIKSGTLHPTVSANKNSILGGPTGGREADRRSPPQESFMALFSSTSIDLDTIAFPQERAAVCWHRGVTQSSTTTWCLHSKEGLGDMQICQSKAPSWCNPEFTSKHHKKYTELKVKSLKEHWVICLQNLVNGDELTSQ